MITEPEMNEMNRDTWEGICGIANPLWPSIRVNITSVHDRRYE